MFVYKLIISVSLDASCIFFFFFQAEDGIRDLTVTGVQTCALPISGLASAAQRARARRAAEARPGVVKPWRHTGPGRMLPSVFVDGSAFRIVRSTEIGRASCRERV